MGFWQRSGLWRDVLDWLIYLGVLTAWFFWEPKTMLGKILNVAFIVALSMFAGRRFFPKKDRP